MMLDPPTKVLLTVVDTDGRTLASYPIEGYTLTVFNDGVSAEIRATAIDTAIAVIPITTDTEKKMTEEAIAAVLTEEQLDMVNELAFIRRDVAALKERESTLRTALLEILDGAPQAITASGEVAVVIQIQHRTSVDGKKLEALFPEIYAQVTKETEVTVVKTPHSA